MANLKKSRLASIGLCHLKKYRNGNYHSRSRHGSYTHAKPVTEQEKRASRGQKSHVKEMLKRFSVHAKSGAHIDCAVAAQLIGAFCFAIYVWSVYMIARITLSGNMQAAMCPTCSGTNGCQGPRPLGPKEIDGLLVSPGKAYILVIIYTGSANV